MGRRNTGAKSQVQEFQRLRIIRKHKSKEKASCLGKNELRPQGIGPLKTQRQIKWREGCCIDCLNRQHKSGVEGNQGAERERIVCNRPSEASITIRDSERIARLPIPNRGTFD